MNSVLLGLETTRDSHNLKMWTLITSFQVSTSLFMIKTNTVEKLTLTLDIKQWTADLYVQHYIDGREMYRSRKPPYRHNARFVWLSRKPRILGVQFKSHPNSGVAHFNTKIFTQIEKNSYSKNTLTFLIPKTTSSNQNKSICCE